jgi:hypothetical protein
MMRLQPRFKFFFTAAWSDCKITSGARVKAIPPADSPADEDWVIDATVQEVHADGSLDLKYNNGRLEEKVASSTAYLLDACQPALNVIDMLIVHYGSWCEAISVEIYLMYVIKISLTQIVHGYYTAVVEQKSSFEATGPVHRAFNRDHELLKDFYSKTYGDLSMVRTITVGLLAMIPAIADILVGELECITPHFDTLKAFAERAGVPAVEVLSKIVNKRKGVTTEDKNTAREMFFTANPDLRPKVVAPGPSRMNSIFTSSPAKSSSSSSSSLKAKTSSGLTALASGAKSGWASMKSKMATVSRFGNFRR